MRTMKNTIKEFSHRVAICSVQDVVESSESVSIVKEIAQTRWAKILTKKPPSKWTTAGYSEENLTNLPTHQVVIRFDRLLDISSAAWVYEKRMQSGDRWYRVVSTKELDDDSQFLILECVLKQRGTVTTPVLPKEEKTQSGINLAAPNPLSFSL